MNEARPPADDDRRARRWRWFGFALCAVPAAILAACSASDGDDTAPDDAAIQDTIAEVTEVTEVPSTENRADTTVADDVSDEPGAETESAGDADEGIDQSDDELDDGQLDDGNDSEADPGAGPISFASEVAPIVERTCASCHTGKGPGTQHVVMDTAAMVAASSGAIDIVIESGFMPPWPASDESVDFQHDWSLTDDERELLAAWHALGAPLDVEPTSAIEPSDRAAVIDDPDIVVDADGTYDGELGQPDEYRCFVFDPGITERKFVRSMEFRPDQERVVHHAVGSVIAAADRGIIEAAAAAEDDGQGGWTCFGFTPAPSADLILGWAPGQAATVYEDGSGLLMEPGDLFVLQIHYHYEVEAPADRSQLAIEWVPDDEVDDTVPIDVGVYLAPAEIPCTADESGPLCDRTTARDAAIEKYGRAGVLADVLLSVCGYSADDFAGMTDGIATASCEQPVNSTGKILNVFGHEHELGQSFRMTLNPGGPDERVLLDIPRWDFDWQLLYEPVEEIILRRGDRLLIECTWDRSLRDPTLEPAYVLWADGTDDEMCFATVTTRPL